MSAAKTPAPGSAIHQPFSWLIRQAGYSHTDEFVALTKDVCDGIQKCLELVTVSALDHDHNEDANPGQQVSPLLSLNDMDRLMRLATASAGMLSHEADRHLEVINRLAWNCWSWTRTTRGATSSRTP